jgi:molybdopterin converting factor small subunit
MLTKTEYRSLYGSHRIPKTEIKFLSTFFDVTKTKNTKLSFPNGADLNYLLNLMTKKFGPKFSEHVREHLEYVMIFVNSIDYRQLKGLETKIFDGDTITMGHVLGGGLN